MKLAYILVFFLSSVGCFSQTMEGDYFGKFRKSRNILEYDSIRISLKSDNTFTFSYADPHVCASVGEFDRFCSGTYIIKGDTLILKSKYSANNFYVIKESREKSILSDSSLLILKPSKEIYLTGAKIRLTIDSIYSGTYQIGDTVVISNLASNIELRSTCLYDMDWMVNLKKRSISKTYNLLLNLKISNENLSFDDKKFIISQDKISLLENLNFIDIINKELIKK